MNCSVTLEEPFFMTNKDWYVFDKKLRRLVLTDEAPPKAIESYKEFYQELDNQFFEEEPIELTE